MTTQLTAQDDPPPARTTPRKPPGPPPNGGAVYGLGMIGALVWFWRDATGPGEHLFAVIKAIVWPAILVHDAFKALRR